ncbi:tetratricopeptide repeat protein [Evansella clarkii]|uniref:tetratricopeptide repeat protein n=1 Tax=Evansella clarkii TaxID=79879 RepID=UPI0009967147|nr:tetratricopeptide repeat protein [Evansella clarkii]
MLSTILSVSKKVFDNMRNPKKAYTNHIIKALIKATHREKKLNSERIKDIASQDIEQLKAYYNNLQVIRRDFDFYSTDANEHAEELYQYFNNIDLNYVDKFQVIRNIVKSAQKIFIESVVNDEKLVRFIELKQNHYFKELIQLSKDEVISDHSNAQHDFGEIYNKAIFEYEDNNFDIAYSIIIQGLASSNYNEKQIVALNILKSSIEYSQYQYDKAYKTLIGLEDQISEDSLYKFRYYGSLGCVLSENGVINKNGKMVRLGIKHFEKQLRLLEKLDNLDKEAYLIYYNLGTSYLALATIDREDPETALQYYKLALELDNRAPELYKNMGSVYGLLHLHDKEVEFYEKALSLNPNLFEGLCAMGAVKLKYENNPKDALKYYKKALMQENEIQRFPGLFKGTAEAYLKNNQINEAVEIIDRGLKYFPTNEILVEQKIEVLVALQRKFYGEYTEHLVSYIKEHKTPLDNVYAEKIAAAYLVAKQYDKLDDFLEDLPKKIKLAPELLFIYYLYANRLIEKDDSEKALVMIEMIENIDPNSFEDKFLQSFYHFALATLQSSLNIFDKALLNYQCINTNYFIKEYEKWLFIGETFLNLENFKDARKSFENAKKDLQGSNFDIEIGLCESNLHLGKTAIAKQSFILMVNFSTTALASMLFNKKNTQEEITKAFNESRMKEVIQFSIQLALVKTLNHLERKGLRKEGISEERYSKLFASYYLEFRNLVIENINQKLHPSGTFLVDHILTHIEKALEE